MFGRMLYYGDIVLVFCIKRDLVNLLDDVVLGGVPELADGPDLGSGAERRVGSSPTFPT